MRELHQSGWEPQHPLRLRSQRWGPHHRDQHQASGISPRLVDLRSLRQVGSMHRGGGPFDGRAHHPIRHRVGGSQWTLLGSQADLTVPSNCALRNMAAYGRTKYLLSSGVSHAEYIHLTSENDTADVSYKRGSSDWTTDYTSPWPVKWSRLALSETTW